MSASPNPVPRAFSASGVTASTNNSASRAASNSTTTATTNNNNNSGAVPISDAVLMEIARLSSLSPPGQHRAGVSISFVSAAAQRVMSSPSARASAVRSVGGSSGGGSNQGSGSRSSNNNNQGYFVNKNADVPLFDEMDAEEFEQKYARKKSSSVAAAAPAATEPTTTTHNINASDSGNGGRVSPRAFLTDDEDDDDDDSVGPPPLPPQNNNNSNNQRHQRTASESPPPPPPGAPPSSSADEEGQHQHNGNEEEEDSGTRFQQELDKRNNSVGNNANSKKHFDVGVSDQEAVVAGDDEEDEEQVDYSILRDAATKKHASPEKHPDNADVERSFHQLRLEQRVAGELAGVLREHAKPPTSLAAALDRQKEARRKRDEFLAREALQLAREKETTYQQEEVASQTIRRLDGLTDVLQRSIDCEQGHFASLRALEDRIIEKQRAAQRKKAELQRLQEIAEDCIGQLTNFELHNAQRERVLSRMEADLEKREKEWKAVDEAFEQRNKAVTAREAKISEWVEALETKEKHLTTADRDLQAFADEFLKREEAVRLARKENRPPGMGHSPPPPPQQQQSQQQQTQQGQQQQAPLNPPGIPVSRLAQMKQQQFYSNAPPNHVVRGGATTAQQPANAMSADPLTGTPEALDKDDDDMSPGLTPGRHPQPQHW